MTGMISRARSGNIFRSLKWVALDGTATCTDGAGFGGTGPGSIRT